MRRNTTGPKKLTASERDAKMWQLRIQGCTQREIAEQTGVTQGTVSQTLRAMLARREMHGGDMLRAWEVDKLDKLERELWEIYNRRHVTVAPGGRVAQDRDGNDILDDGPKLQAIDRLLKVAERRAKLLGIDSPQQVVAASTVRYEIVGVDMNALR